MEGQSGGGASVGDENAEAYGIVRQLHIPLVIRLLCRTHFVSDELMSCAAGTNGCLDLRRRAFALDGYKVKMSLDASSTKCVQ